MQALLRRLHARSERGNDDGFTLVELVITIGLVAFLFAAVAGILTSSLKALAIQKARTQGNEIATQAIEDLQRRSFDNLVLCEGPSGTAPDGLDSTVIGSGCPAGPYTTYGEDPCNNLNPLHAPDPEYVCRRVGVNYTVKRYIAWVDEGHTSKRLAVFVDWVDAVGHHEVSQQSSLRAPGAASIIGLANPTLTASAGSVPSNPAVAQDGGLTSPVSVSVNSTNLTAADRVFVKYTTLNDEGAPVVDTVSLSGSSAWSGIIPAGTKFPTGTQFFTFNAVRAADGKTTAAVSPAVKFCRPSDATCASSALPNITSMSAPTATIPLSAAGGLTADFSVSVSTRNVPATGRVQVLLPTQAGIEAIDLLPQTGCSLSSCTWSGVVPKATGYAFKSGSTSLYFSVAQPYTLAGPATEQGSTDSNSRGVTFG